MPCGPRARWPTVGAPFRGLVCAGKVQLGEVLVTSERAVALLRGINVGGNNKLPMAELVGLCRALGWRDVATYIQSGNVVFHVDKTPSALLERQLAEQLRANHGLNVPVVVRTARELQATVAANPFLAAGAAPETLHVAFLADEPNATLKDRLDPNRSPGDRFAVLGRDVHLWCPNGFGRTKLTNAWLDASLKTTSTVRNWRTVQHLVAMCSDSTPDPAPAGAARRSP